MPETTNRQAVKHSFSSSGIMPRQWTNDVGQLLSNIVGHNGINVRVRLGAPGLDIIYDLPYDQQPPFWVTQSRDNSDKNTVKVKGGTWTRNGVAVSINDTLVAGISTPNTQYQIKLNIYNTSGLSDDGAYPDGIQFEAIASPTTGDTFYSSYPVGASVPDPAGTATDWEDSTDPGQNVNMVIAVVKTDDAGAIDTIQQIWYGGAIDDVSVVPDSDADGSLTANSGSIQFKPGSWESNQHELMIHGFIKENGDPPDGSAFDTSDLFIVRSSGDVVIYCTAEVVGNAVNTYIRHENLEDITGGGGVTNDDHDGRYWVQGDTYDNTCFGQSIGTGTAPNTPGGVMRIDITSGRLVDNATGSNYTVDWLNRLLDKGSATAGATVGWTVNSGTKLLVADTTASTANDTGALQVKGGINFQEDCYGDDGTYTVTMLDSVLSHALSAGDSSGNAVQFADGTWAVNATGGIYNYTGGIESDEGNITITTSGNFKHLGNTGATSAASGVSGGIVFDVAAFAGGAEVKSAVDDILTGYGLI